MGSRARTTPDTRTTDRDLPIGLIKALAFLALAAWLAYLSCLTYLTVKGLPTEPLTSAISGKDALIPSAVSAVTLVVALASKRQTGRVEAQTGRVLPEVIRERTEALQHAPLTPPRGQPAVHLEQDYYPPSAPPGEPLWVPPSARDPEPPPPGPEPDPVGVPVAPEPQQPSAAGLAAAEQTWLQILHGQGAVATDPTDTSPPTWRPRG